MAYVLALLSAVCYGAADFLGGLSARRAHTSAVIVLSGMAGLSTLALFLPLVPGTPTFNDFRWGAIAGLAGGAGIGLLYRGLAVGRMAVVAPTTAVCAVIIPALASFLGGERLPAMTVGGILLALVAIVLVGQTKEDEPGRPARRGLGLAFLSGVAIGFFYLALARTSPAAGLWPLVASRGTSVAIFALVALAGRHTLRLDRAVLRMVLFVGAIDMTANALYVLATRGGPLSVIVTLSSLYPASTVILARAVLGERLSPLQIAGVALALLAVAMIVGVF